MTNPFSKALLRAQMRRQGQEVGRKSLPPMQDDWRENLYPSLVPEAERLINEGLPRHSHLEARGAVRGALSGWEPEGGCPFAGDWQQPMRNHALALALVDAGQASFWHLALVHHDQNPYVSESWEAYRLASAASTQLHRWPASTLLTALSEALQDPSYTSWMTSRYVLDEEIKYEL